ncbi:MAG: hypothetical protein HY403_02050 [Elusimicrobia bacterium]|nr:hypothetical protein [Elusimicrobiota bacterium]
MKAAAVLLVAAALGVLVETGLALLPLIANKYLWNGMFYFPPRVTRERYERYLAVRDPVVGWPARARRGLTPRSSPASLKPGRPCVTLYGDSYTFGAEVSDEEAWGNILARRLGCRVDNFGVNAYGTDQALLRFIGNRGDKAPVTIVGVYADNPARNVNQYRYFLNGQDAASLGLKPRFVLDEGRLSLIEIPRLSYEQFMAAMRDPRAFFPHEGFLPGTGHGPAIWTFPYALKLPHLVRANWEIFKSRGGGRWLEFYQPGHDSRALPTTVAIIEEFRRRAATGKTVVVALHPTPGFYELKRLTGASPYRTLAVELESRGILVRDLTTDFASYLGERDFCELLVNPASCSGHYNPEGNRVVAGAVQAFLAAGGRRRRP